MCVIFAPCTKARKRKMDDADELCDSGAKTKFAPGAKKLATPLFI